MRILLVEDNYQDRMLTERLLREAVGDVEIRWLNTESAFWHWLRDASVTPPDLVMLDIKLPWAEAAPVIEAVPDDYDGNDNAGIRCFEGLRTEPRFAAVPVILLTHKTSVRVPSGATYLPKGERRRLGEVIRQIQAARQGA